MINGTVFHLKKLIGLPACGNLVERDGTHSDPLDQDTGAPHCFQQLLVYEPPSRREEVPKGEEILGVQRFVEEALIFIAGIVDVSDGARIAAKETWSPHGEDFSLQGWPHRQVEQFLCQWSATALAQGCHHGCRWEGVPSLPRDVANEGRDQCE